MSSMIKLTTRCNNEITQSKYGLVHNIINCQIGQLVIEQVFWGIQEPVENPVGWGVNGMVQSSFPVFTDLEA